MGLRMSVVATDLAIARLEVGLVPAWTTVGEFFSITRTPDDLSTDYLLVKAGATERAVQALSAAGHTVVGPA